jgi:hypothetical protein
VACLFLKDEITVIRVIKMSSARSVKESDESRCTGKQKYIEGCA